MLVSVATAAVLVCPDALGASRASGSSVQAVLAQCSSGHLSGDYTLVQLRQALHMMQSAVMQYTSCPDVVQAAILGAQHHGGSIGAISSGGSFLPTPVLAILGLLILGAGAFSVLALRRR
jgi:hypothetical protein